MTATNMNPELEYLHRYDLRNTLVHSHLLSRFINNANHHPGKSVRRSLFRLITPLRTQISKLNAHKPKGKV